jgi:bacterioferritin
MLDPTPVSRQSVASSESSIVARTRVISLLNEALATELASAMRAKSRYYAVGDASDALRERFLEQAVGGAVLADRLAERIAELGGLPDFSSARSLEGGSPGSTREMIDEDLCASRGALEAYRRMITLLAAVDATSSSVLQDVFDRRLRLTEELSSLESGLLAH